MQFYLVISLLTKDIILVNQGYHQVNWLFLIRMPFNEVSKMLAYFYGDFVGLEGAAGLRSDQPCRRRVSKGDEFKAVPAPPAPAASRPAAGKNGARPADEPPAAPPCQGAEAGAGDSAPGEGAEPRQATSKPATILLFE